MHDTARETAVL